MQLPPKGLDKKALLAYLEKAKEQDADWRRGRTFSLVYYLNQEHSDFIKSVYYSYFHENSLSPKAFPSLLHMEREVVGMLLNLLAAPPGGCGNMTSGGTESILLAVKTYRDRAQAHNHKLTRPQMVLPQSAHPSFFKAAQYFGLDAVSVPVDANFQADPELMVQAINERTILLVAGAPSFPQGVVDPIDRLGELALQRGLGLHVDACLGGLFLPFLPELGRSCAKWDFSVPGVSSISTDLHKYGFAAKGASALLFREPELWRHQFHVDTRWSGGVYTSPTMLGTKSGGVVAAAWAALMCQGYEGYKENVRLTLELTEKMQSGLVGLGLKILGSPVTGVFAVTSCEYDLLQAAQMMADKKWWLDCLNEPQSLHLVITPNHAQSIEQFLADLAQVLPGCRLGQGAHKQKQAVLYGMTSNIDSAEDLEKSLLDSLVETYKPSPNSATLDDYAYETRDETALIADFFRPQTPPAISSHGNSQAADRLRQVCQDPDISPLLGGREIVLDPDLAVSFRAGQDGVLFFNPAFTSQRPAAALHLRHGLELCLWLEIIGKGATLPERIAAAILACRTTAIYRQGRLSAERKHMMLDSPAWLARGLDFIKSPNLRFKEEKEQLADLAVHLMDLQDVGEGPSRETVLRDWPLIAKHLENAWEVAAPTEHILTTGGDSRMDLSTKTGLNNYGCSPRPRPWAVTFASSTASSISNLAFARAEYMRKKLMAAAWECGLGSYFTQAMVELRKELAGIWAGAGGCKVILTNSGTDAESIALFIALCQGDKPLVNVLVASEETGKGVRFAAAGRHFTAKDLDGIKLGSGKKIQGLSVERVTLEAVRVRDKDAIMVPGGEIDERIETITRQAVEEGARVLLHIVESTKTGLTLPSLACLDNLAARYGEHIDVVVDACQLRLSDARLDEYLKRGCMVFITGSKFYTGPPFSGAILVPPKYIGRIKSSGIVPVGFGRFSSRNEWPQSWENILGSLPRRRNLGLLLRWHAALWEMRAFKAVKPADRLHILSSFGWEVLSAIIRNPDLRLIPFQLPPRPESQDLMVWDRVPSIFTFAPMRSQPDKEARPLTSEEAKYLYQWLNDDISSLLAGRISQAEMKLAKRKFHIGQPVEMIDSEGEKIIALRISAGARLVSGVLFDPELGSNSAARLKRETGDALAAIDKISLILKCFDKIKTGKSRAKSIDELHLI